MGKYWSTPLACTLPLLKKKYSASKKFRKFSNVAELRVTIRKILTFVDLVRFCHGFARYETYKFTMFTEREQCCYTLHQMIEATHQQAWLESFWCRNMLALNGQPYWRHNLWQPSELKCCKPLVPSNVKAPFALLIGHNYMCWSALWQVLGVSSRWYILLDYHINFIWIIKDFGNVSFNGWVMQKGNLALHASAWWSALTLSNSTSNFNRALQSFVEIMWIKKFKT